MKHDRSRTRCFKRLTIIVSIIICDRNTICAFSNIYKINLKRAACEQTLTVLIGNHQSYYITFLKRASNFTDTLNAMRRLFVIEPLNLVFSLTPVYSILISI